MWDSSKPLSEDPPGLGQDRVGAEEVEGQRSLGSQGGTSSKASKLGLFCPGS